MLATVAMFQSLTSPRAKRLLALGLVAATFVAYLPAWHGQFLWDDDSWTSILADLMHDRRGLGRMWSDPGALQQYYPLSGTTFWLDAQFWGGWTLPYHLENIALHAVAALLVWRLLARWAVPGAALAGAVFALHPVMVESVAWITERKNVLSLVLYLAALGCYSRFAGDWLPPGDTARRQEGRWGWYAAALGLFVAALTAKVTAFSLPAVVLLLGWWRRGTIRPRADVLPTLPFLALSVGFGLTVSALERDHLGAQGPDFAFSLAQRVLIAGRVLWFYPAKLLWPAYQSFIYPRWEINTHDWMQWIYPVTAVPALLAPWLLRGRLGRGPAAAVFFYAGTLFPAVGLLNGYFMAYAFVWDHLVYVSSLGIIVLAAAGVATVAERLGRPWLTAAVAATVLPVLAALTWRQSAMYQDAVTLYRTTIRQNPACWLAYGNLGSELVARGRVGEGMAMYEQAIALRPGYAEAHNNLANAYARTGRAEQAVAQYEAALAADPGMTGVHGNFAVVLRSLGRLDEALGHYREAARSGRHRAEALAALAGALREKGEEREAEARYAQALALRPGDVGLANELAFVLATADDPGVRDGEKALKLARRVEEATGGTEPGVGRTVAAAEAACGRFAEAAEAARRAAGQADERGDTALAAELREDVKKYEERQQPEGRK